MGTAVTVLAWLAGAALALAAGFVVSFRTGFRPVLTLVRRLNRRFANPRQLRTAGTPGAYAGVVEHEGRRTGTAYRTPIGIDRRGDRLVVTLPYGSGTDWVRNVLATGTATVVHEGERLRVRDPRIVGRAEIADGSTREDLRTAALFGIDEFLVLEVDRT